VTHGKNKDKVFILPKIHSFCHKYKFWESKIGIVLQLLLNNTLMNGKNICKAIIGIHYFDVLLKILKK